ncbi:TfoX/Sxy family protein [Methylococcus sp. EFPC2]|uniref:TfoX/Sxy family protein n=1 Tax=Methylococcus sp. EFPC2 TaxID=2812648 RepID=UPI001F07346E|nr:TfoX/Sxy family protein [Methylococcus sp. EFPC2]
MNAHQPSCPASLEERIRSYLIGLPVSEKRMFGGISFLLNGNVLCCASKKGVMARVGKDAEPQALAHPMAKRCDGAGHPMPGFISIEPDGIRQDDALASWLQMALNYVSTLPPKSEKTKDKPRYSKRRDQ